MTKKNLDKLKKWRQKREQEYADVLMNPPEKTNLLQAIRTPGVYVIMGERGSGKSGLAHEAAERIHNKRHLPAVLHLPKIPPKLHREIQGLLPEWMKVVHDTDDWPKGAVVIYDEASQSAHARRTQATGAVELDNLVGISRQRGQTVLFISHHSRKLDPNLITEADRIIWKQPTYAHFLFERDEMSDFTMKAIDFFRTLSESQAKRHSLMMDFHKFQFQTFTNGLPSYWSDKLSRLFENIKSVHKEK